MDIASPYLRRPNLVKWPLMEPVVGFAQKMVRPFAYPTRTDPCQDLFRLPSATGPSPLELLMVRLHLKAEQMAIEIFARTKSFRDADRKLRKARLDELLKNTRNWVKPEITRWFTDNQINTRGLSCLLYTSPSPRDGLLSRMPSSA